MSNITLNSGTGGATLGTDTVTGTPNVDYQIVKLGLSASGAAPTQADGNSGNKSAGTLRVVIATDQPSLTNAQPVSQSGTWSVNLGTLNGVALDTSVNGLLISQGTALGTSKGPLLQGSVTTSAPTYTTGNINPLSLTTSGALRVDIGATSANGTAIKVDGSAVTQPVSGTFWQATQPVSGTVTANAVQSGTWTVQPGNTANTTPWLVTDTPATSGGLSFSYTLSAASNNLTQAKASAGQLFTVVVTNTNAAARYLKIFNKASASVTMGTTAADFQFVIPGNTAGAGLAINIDKGIALGTGITYAITAGVSLTDNTSVAANEVSALIGYK